jgi:hypothetical protein
VYDDAFEAYGQGLELAREDMDRLADLFRPEDRPDAAYPGPTRSCTTTCIRSRSSSGAPGPRPTAPTSSTISRGRPSPLTRSSTAIPGDVHWNEEGHRLIADGFLEHYGRNPSRRTTRPASPPLPRRSPPERGPGPATRSAIGGPAPPGAGPELAPPGISAFLVRHVARCFGELREREGVAASSGASTHCQGALTSSCSARASSIWSRRGVSRPLSNAVEDRPLIRALTSSARRISRTGPSGGAGFRWPACVRKGVHPPVLVGKKGHVCGPPGASEGAFSIIALVAERRQYAPPPPRASRMMRRR